MFPYSSIIRGRKPVPPQYGVIEQYVEQLRHRTCRTVGLLKMACDSQCVEDRKEALSEEEKNHLFDHFPKR